MPIAIGLRDAHEDLVAAVDALYPGAGGGWVAAGGEVGDDALTEAEHRQAKDRVGKLAEARAAGDWTDALKFALLAVNDCRGGVLTIPPPPRPLVAYPINHVAIALKRGDIRIQGEGRPVLEPPDPPDDVPGSVMLELFIGQNALEARGFEIRLKGRKAQGFVCGTEKPEKDPDRVKWHPEFAWAAESSASTPGEESPWLSTPTEIRFSEGPEYGASSAAAGGLEPVMVGGVAAPGLGRVRVEDIKITGARQALDPRQEDGRSRVAVGLHLHGDLSLVEVIGCTVEDVSTDVPRRHADDDGSQARGVEVVWDTGDEGRHIRRTVLRDCTIRNVYFRDPETGRVPTTDKPPANVDGLALGKFGIPARSSVEVLGCTFENCHVRSIKGQVTDLRVRACRFFRWAFSGSKEVDAQIGGLIATGNEFHYAGYDVDAILQLGVRWDSQGRMKPKGPLVVDDNYVLVQMIDVEAVRSKLAVLFTQVEGDSPIPPAAAAFDRVLVTRNTVDGPLKFLVSTASPVGGSLWVEGNQIDDVPADGAFLQLKREPHWAARVPAFDGSVRFNGTVRGAAPVLAYRQVPGPDSSNLDGLQWHGNANFVLPVADAG